MTAIEQWRAPSAETVQYVPSMQDQAIARLADWAQSAEAAYGVASRLVQTSFCPDQFRGKAGEATAAILAGMEVGLQPMAALRSFDIIQNTAAPKAITLRAIVQSFGHEIELTESTATRCKMRGRRRGSSAWQEVVWTIDRAKQLGVTNKPNWRNQPQTMLVARATSEITRLIASDAILGIGYSSEELADGLDGDSGAPAPASVSPVGSKRMSRAKAEPPPPPPPEADPEPADEADPGVEMPDPISDQQSKKIHALFRDIGVDNRDDRLRMVSSAIGREVESSKDLTKAEASELIEHLLLISEPPADASDPDDPMLGDGA